MVRRSLVELHVAEDEHGPDHLLLWQPGVHRRAEDPVEHRLEVGVESPVHSSNEAQLLLEGFSLDRVDFRAFAERDHPARPWFLAEVRDEQAQGDAHLHRGAGHATGHVAHGDAVAQRALLAEVVHHPAPLQLRHGVSLAAVRRGRDLVGQERARRDLGLPGLHVFQVLAEARLVVLLEEELVAPHGHGRHAGVGEVGPPLGAHVHLGELQDLAQRHQHLAAETMEHAVGVVLLRKVGVVRVGVPREEAAGDGLAEQCRPVERRAWRGAPLGGEPDLLLLAARGELLEVRGEEVGEELGDAVEQEAVGAIAVVRLQRVHGEPGRLGHLLRRLLLHLPGHLLLLRRLGFLLHLHRLRFGLLLHLHRLIRFRRLRVVHRGHGRRFPASLGRLGLGPGERGGEVVGERGLAWDRGGGDAVLAGTRPSLRQLRDAELHGPARLVSVRLGLGELADVGPVDEAVQQLGEVLEVAELGERGDVAGERARVALVHPQRGGVEAVLVGLARAAHAAEVGDELERGERVVVPGGGDERAHAVGRRVRDHLEEEVHAGVPGAGVGGGVVVGARLPRRLGGLGGGVGVGRVEAGVEEVEEGVGGRGLGVGDGGWRWARTADGGRAEEHGGHGGVDRIGRSGY